MDIVNISDMVNGWFVGSFKPTLVDTEDVEIALKSYNKGDEEARHFHKVATEITLVVSGRVKMFDKEWKEGDIIVVEPGDITGFEALDDSLNAVIKIPSVKGDKYVVEGEN